MVKGPSTLQLTQEFAIEMKIALFFSFFFNNSLLLGAILNCVMEEENKLIFHYVENFNFLYKGLKSKLPL